MQMGVDGNNLGQPTQSYVVLGRLKTTMLSRPEMPNGGHDGPGASREDSEPTHHCCLTVLCLSLMDSPLYFSIPGNQFRTYLHWIMSNR